MNLRNRIIRIRDNCQANLESYLEMKIQGVDAVWYDVNGELTLDYMIAETQMAIDLHDKAISRLSAG